MSKSVLSRPPQLPLRSAFALPAIRTEPRARCTPTALTAQRGEGRETYVAKVLHLASIVAMIVSSHVVMSDDPTRNL